MNYQDTLDYLFGRLPMYQNMGDSAFKPGLERITQICERLNNPQNNFKSIHIAGTNGKGSVASMLASILQECGYKVGLYTSPHFKDFRERIKINGKCIPKQTLIDFVEKGKSWENLEPSFFEYSTALAFDYFSKEKVDVAVIETGLGGRLDSTNVIKPILSVITSISLDHTQFLGNTVQEIAREKAGIIKENTPIVTGAENRDVLRVFKEEAKLKNAPFHTSYGNELDAFEAEGSFKEENIALVLKSTRILKEQGFDITLAKRIKGLSNTVENTGFFGRWYRNKAESKIIYDVAHNTSGVQHVLQKAKALSPFSQWNFVFGMVKDKDHQKIMALLPKESQYFICAADVPRALPAKELESILTAEGFSCRAYDSVQLAKEDAMKKNNSFTLVFGSFFVVAEALPKNIFEKFE